LLENLVLYASHFWPTGHGLHTPVLGFWKNEHCFPYLKADARELLCITVTLAPLEGVFDVAVSMLRHPETTTKRVKLMTLGITAIEIQLD